MVDPKEPWSHRLRLYEVQRGAQAIRLEADSERRAAIARRLDLLDLLSLRSDMEVRPWLDGAEVRADWSARFTQTCGVSLEPFETEHAGRFIVRVVPADSPAARSGEAELSLDPEAEDPPDVLEGDQIDLAAYLVEHLALEIDPFPRKPGVEFEPPPAEGPQSPFAVLQALKGEPPRG